SELRLVLLGNSGSQRNQVGNIILGGTVFTEEPVCCVRVSGRCMWKPTVLINTPDLLHLNVSEDKVTEHVEQCVRLSDPGPHVFLLVLQPEDFTEQHRLRLQTVLENCGDGSFEHSLVLISTMTKEPSAENYLEHPPLKELIKLCRYRYVMQKNLELQELLVRCGQIVKENNGEHVICDLSEDGAAQSDPNPQQLTEPPANFNPAQAAGSGQTGRTGMEVPQGTGIQPGRKGEWRTGGLWGSGNKQGTGTISTNQMQSRETIRGKALEGFRQR
ncbi:hypothetical protein XENOCAPTIV_024332, partial [Xenoophorus captivus]